MFLKSTCNIDFLEMIMVIVIVHPKRFSHVGGMIKENNGLVIFKGQMFIFSIMNGNLMNQKKNVIYVRKT